MVKLLFVWKIEDFQQDLSRFWKIYSFKLRVEKILGLGLENLKLSVRKP